MKLTAPRRAALMGKVHALAKKLGYDDGTYRTVLLTQTGKTSCRDMTDAQLSRLSDALECLSLGKPMPPALNVPQASPNLLGGQALPTVKQWETLAALVHREGWSGLEDARLLRFARHTAKVDELAELSRAAMSKVISGLGRMLSQQAKTTHKEAI
jgi:hypothetical protein